ncbi:MAG: hypothetical protein WDN00_01640 [Limisphaerales bacterium]
MVFKNTVRRETIGATFTFSRATRFCSTDSFHRKTFADDTNQWWSDVTEQALSQAGTNRAEILTVLNQTPVVKRAEIQFLIENAPVLDLQTLSSQFLLENLTLADEALPPRRGVIRCRRTFF